MQYLCIKQITVCKVAYHPGEVIPDGVILPERSGKLVRSGYISELNMEIPEASGQEKVFTKKEVDAMVADAVAETEKRNEDRVAGLQGYIAELLETVPGAYEGTIQIAVKGTSDGENGQVTAIPASPEEIRQVFAIMQMNAEDGAKAISDVTSENVLILLHTADSRKTVREAAKKRADNLSLTGVDPNESGKGNESTEPDMEGVDA